MKKTLSLLTAALLLIAVAALPACAPKAEVPQELSFFAMDTYMTLKVYRGERTENEADAALSAAKDEIQRIEKLMSVTDESSEIAALNRGEVLENASADLVRLLNIAAELYEKTDGAYDVTVYPLMLAWGFTTEQGPAVPSADSIREALEEIDGAAVTVTENGVGGYRVSTGGKRLDLGSIAKGYAAKRAADIIIESGFESGLLILGGNVQTFGKKPNGSGFNIGIADPTAPERAITTISTDTLDRIFRKSGTDENTETRGSSPSSYAIVTSGTYQRYFNENGTTYHHIMDVKSGYPCNNGLASVTVICPDGAMADGLSTALFSIGYDKAMDYYRDHGGFEAIFIKDTGEILRTDGIAD